MTQAQAQAYNAAIDAAVKAYPNGIGAIMALRIKHVVTVEHIGTTTVQTVEDLEK
jgi:hypothetical protein